jgi:DAK2 domain fusion protein YloV
LIGAGLAWLELNYNTVNQLNVFPVPDGDTGTNMLLTLRNAYAEIADKKSDSAGELAYALAHRMIYMARGNSGTILSQLFRGFANVAHNHTELNAQIVATAFREAVKMAYDAVQKPTEGTILTVARETSDEVQLAAAETDDLRVILQRAVVQAQKSLARTPELLPILKKAGVVDSGGQGLVFILEWMLRHAEGETLIPQGEKKLAVAEVANLGETLRSEDERGYGYDVQFLLRGQNLDLETVRSAINSMGDSGVIIGDSSLIKVHIHVHDPGIPISYGVSLGIIGDVVVENMQEQANEYVANRTGSTAPDLPIITVNEGDIAVVAVAAGEGLSRVFCNMGAAEVVLGGQTMNPSTEDLLQAIRRINTDKIILLPNNRNVILTAEQAANMMTDRRVVVIATRTAPQGIAAMLGFSAEGDLDKVVEKMKGNSQNVVTGEVTTATRSIELDGLNVENGQIIGLIDGKLTVAGHDIPGVLRDMLTQMTIQDREIVTLYYGDTVREVDAEALAQELGVDYPAQEFEVLYGGQPYYPYILSAE